MAIGKNNFKASRADNEFLSDMSNAEDEFERSPFESDLDDFDDADSGAGSDDFDLLDLGEPMAEFCQVGNQSCSLPSELYDLPDLRDILCLDVWNDCLTEEERFSLTLYLPDMDQHSFVHTLNDLLSGANFHFGNPVMKLYDMLKGGLCEPRVALYRQALNSFQRREYYHMLKKHHNSMVVNLCMIRDAWRSCRGYSIEEKLRVLNIVRTQRSLMVEKTEEWGIDTGFSEKEDFLLKKRIDKYARPSKARALRCGKQNPKGLLKLGSSKPPPFKDTATLKGTSSHFHKQKMKSSVVPNMKEIYEVPPQNMPQKSGKMKKGGKYDEYKGGDFTSGDSSRVPISRMANFTNELPKKLKQSNSLKQPMMDGGAPFSNGQTRHGSKRGKGFRHIEDEEKLCGPFDYDEWSPKPKKSKAMRDSDKLKSMSSKVSSRKISGRLPPTGFGGIFQQGNEDRNKAESLRMFLKDSKDEETESDSSEPDNEDVNPLLMRKSGYQERVLPRTYSLSKPGISNKVKTSKNKSARKLGDSRSFWNSESRHVGECFPGLGFDGIDISEMSSMRGQGVVGTGYCKTEGDSNRPGLLPDCTLLSLGGNGGGDGLLGRKRGLDYAYNHVEVDEFSPHKQVKPSEPHVIEAKCTDKKPFTLITPTFHTGFSFSVIHLLSAVRMAMIIEDPLDTKHDSVAGHLMAANRSAFTVVDIVNRVRSNPGDPCILEMQEPLQDLVRGVLRILSSKTAPLGAKGWKPMVVYEKSAKSWSWVAPIGSDQEELTSPEAWGIAHKLLIKIVDAFANWLKSGQETLREIGSLPAPPESLMQFNLDERERFRDLRAQKSLNTIGPSSEEVRHYFRREEFLRYSIPDRAFTYTAIDGRKSIVAPLRCGGGKPTSKARDHFMLKCDRPPHVTILCLVRDAAARLPGSIGTRADVCTMIRDSQYIVEEVSDAQVNQVVSGALDRLHYERDPCVQFDGERKLWVYLHRDREEEDFEDDGTSSTKKWKRPKKDALEQSDEGVTTTPCQNPREGLMGFDLAADLNFIPEPVDDGLYNDMNLNVGHDMDHNGLARMTRMPWDTLYGESKLLCQQNTNEDFDDEAFGRERKADLLSAGFL